MKPVKVPDPLIRLKEQLELSSRLAEREDDFDMNDDKEFAQAFMLDFPEIVEALRFLEKNVTQPWRIADAAALKSQTWHRGLSKIAIASGTAAIILAIIQLSVRLMFPHLDTASHAFGVLELFAAVAALFAVVSGLIAKFNQEWLAQRCKAERFRMLKFRALTRIGSSPDHQAWEKWVNEQLELENHFDFTVDQWSKQAVGQPENLKWTHGSRDFATALTAYYRIKRLTFQADFFNNRRNKYEQQTEPWRRWSLRIFFGSAAFVIAHVVGEWVVAPWLDEAGRKTAAYVVEIAAVGCLTLAAILPIVGIGVRSWFAAFQLHLSASLYSVKHEELVEAVDHLTDTLSPEVLINQMEQVEHNLNLEHREWLRLLLQTEWFL